MISVCVECHVWGVAVCCKQSNIRGCAGVCLLLVCDNPSIILVFIPAFPCWPRALASVASPCLPMAVEKRAAVVQILKKTL